MAGKNKAYTNSVAKSLKNYSKPHPGFKKTKSLHDVMKMVDEYKIFHLYGMSGSGKSQILAAVCEKLDENPGRIIWNVQCKPGAGCLMREVMGFASQLQQTGMISREDALDESALRERKIKNEFTKFLDVLNGINLSVPALFVIDDIVDDDEKQLLREMIECMEMAYPGVLNIRLLIATQEEGAIYPSIHLSSRDDYRTFQINGFSNTEALEFLCDSKTVQFEDVAKVERLADELAYSPLGLFMAKAYCQEYGKKYEEYYDSLGKTEDVEKEKEIFRKYPELQKHHRYEIIMRLLSPREGDSEEKLIQFRVMQMMSFVSDSHIPTQLLGKLFQVARPMTVVEEKNAKCYLLKRLEREVDAMVWDKDNNTKFLTLHGDVMRVLNASIETEEKSDVLANVVQAFASLLQKDNRWTKHYFLLYDLKSHAEAVAKHATSLFEEFVESDELRNFGAKECKILLGLSKIYEVIGFAISQHPGLRVGTEEDQYYQQAMKCIWAIVRASNDKRSTLARIIGLFKKTREDTKDLISYEHDKDPYETAKEVFKRMKRASRASKEMVEALKDDWEIQFPVNKENLKDMEQSCGETCDIDWEKMNQELNKEGHLSDTSKNKLVAQKMIIGWDKFVKFYLAERMSSILHSRGRLDNYKGDMIPPEMHVKCRWYVEFGFQLCEIIFEKTGVKSIFHYILRANNQLPRLVRNLKEESDEEFWQRIEESREKAHSLVQEDADFFEHGIYKRISGTPWTVMNALKYLVKANTKVHKKPSVAKDFSTSEADEESAKLYKLCENNKDIVISTTCLVHVGKYVAAKEDYAGALETFQSAFKWGIDKKLQTNQATYAWALYNTGRTILAAQDKLEVEDKKKYIERFILRYKLLMANEPPEKWKKILEVYMTEIDKLSGDSGRE